jgi:predicted TIM-barrel fold metal-dependent hydrolase
MLEKNRIPLLFSGTDVTVSQLHAISAAYPELPIILTQCEYPQNRSIYKLLEQHPRIYLEISTYYIYYGIEDIVEKFGAKRLLFGSRMPFQEGGAALGMTLLAAISETDRNKILGGNLDALLSEVRL